MNKRQKKKLYKKLHGHNPPKIVNVQEKVQSQQKLEWKSPYGYAQENEDLATRFKDALQRATITIGESLTACAKRVADAVKTFGIAQRKYDGPQELVFNFVFPDPEPPVVKTAKILTAQRLTGKRNRNHTRNRRK